MLEYWQAILLGLLQGVTELFPVSSLGHSVLIANLFGWHDLTRQQTADSSAFLSLLVMMHLATAIALVIFYRREWVRIGKGFFRSLQTKDITHDSDARLAWLLIAATIPAGLVGLLFEHKFRAIFATGFFAIVFIIVNGIMLIRGDTMVTVAEINRPRRRRSQVNEVSSATKTVRMVSDHLSFRRAIAIGFAQILALFPGISRSGVTMLAGLRNGLSHLDAARFSFLLATPIIFAAGLYRLPDFFSTAMEPIRGQIVVGSLTASIAAYISVRFLDKYFVNKSLRPFGYYCIALGVFVLLVSVIRGASPSP